MHILRLAEVVVHVRLPSLKGISTNRSNYGTDREREDSVSNVEPIAQQSARPPVRRLLCSRNHAEMFLCSLSSTTYLYRATLLDRRVCFALSG